MDRKILRNLIKEAYDVNEDKRMLKTELKAIAEYFLKNYEGGNTLEIGAYKGMTSRLIAGLMHNASTRYPESKHYIVDLFEVIGDTEWNYDEHPQELLLENVGPYSDLVRTHMGDSLSHDAMAFVFANKYDFVFIDGDHRHPNVFMECCMVDGLTDHILLHDYGHKGVTKSVDMFCEQRGYKVSPVLDGTGLFEIVK